VADVNCAIVHISFISTLKKRGERNEKVGTKRPPAHPTLTRSLHTLHTLINFIVIAPPHPTHIGVFTTR